MRFDKGTDLHAIDTNQKNKLNCCFSNSRRFFCGCFVIINKNDVYEYKSGFNRVTDGMVL